MIYNRGNRADFDALVALGNPGWGWDDVLPIYRQMENHALGAGPTRGAGGLLDISTATDLPQLCDDTIEAGVAAGLKRTDDVNDSDEERIGPAARTITRGTRVSSARSFLRPVLGRPNLTVRTGATVTQVLVEGDRAVGVRVTDGGTMTDQRAALEVVLSLGSLATPRLLQLSGIGDAAHLRGIGIDARVDSPDVGQRMREHRTVTLQYRLRGSVQITSADPTAPLDIDPQFLTSASDRQRTAALFRRIRDLFGLEPVASKIRRETVPGPGVQSDDEIVDAALDLGYCGYHAVGTAAMGPDPGDVVDSRLRVRGLRGLRIVDCSVLPTMVAGNLNAPIMAMAWRAADLMREDA